MLLDASERLTSVQGRIGLLQERLDRAGAGNAAAYASLEMARNTIVSADPFATATALSQVQVQMETLYSVTARLSSLKLVNYLR